MISAGQEEKGLLKTEEAIAKGVKTGQMYLLKGNALFKTGKMEDAKNAYRQALTIEPNLAAARQMLTQLGG